VRARFASPRLACRLLVVSPPSSCALCLCRVSRLFVAEERKGKGRQGKDKERKGRETQRREREDAGRRRITGRSNILFPLLCVPCTCGSPRHERPFERRSSTSSHSSNQCEPEGCWHRSRRGHRCGCCVCACLPPSARDTAVLGRSGAQSAHAIPCHGLSQIQGSGRMDGRTHWIRRSGQRDMRQQRSATHARSALDESSAHMPVNRWLLCRNCS
jgi:hypothetical protein